MYRGKYVFVFSLILLVLLFIPTVYLFVGVSLFKSIGGYTFTLWQFLTSPSNQGLIGTTLAYALTNAVFTTTIATAYAWIVARTDVPLKRLFELIAVFALTMPLVVKALMWIFLFDPNSGLINKFFESLTGTSSPIFNIYTFPGLLFASTLGAFPLSYLIILPAMKSLNFSLEEASMVSGSRIIGTLRRITIPIVLPGLLSAFFLTVIGTLSNFDYTQLIGIPGNIHVLATEIYYYAQGRTPPSYGDASIISSIYVAVTAVALMLYIFFTRKTFKYVTLGSSFKSGVIKLHKWKWAAFVICCTVLFFEFVLPFSTLIYLSFVPVVGATTNAFVFFEDAFNIGSFFGSLEATLFVGIVASILTTIVAALLAFSALKTKVRGSRLIETVPNLPLAFPPIVYAIALFWAFLLLPGFNSLFGTIWPIIIALSFFKLPYASRIISSNLVQVSNDMEEASQTSGASFITTFARVTLPLTRGGMLYSILYVFVDSLRELGGVVLLATPGATMFTVMLLQYYYSTHSPLSINVISAASLMLTMIIISALVAVNVLDYVLARRNRRADEERLAEKLVLGAPD